MDIQSPPDVFNVDIESKIAPIHESINTVNTSSSAPFSVEKVEQENIFQLNTVSQENNEDPKKIPFIENGMELIQQHPMVITFDQSQLGEDGVIKDGTEILIDGMKARIYYSEELYPEISIIKYAGNRGLPKLCEVAPYFFLLSDSAYGRSFSTTPYATVYGGDAWSESLELTIPANSDSIYGIIPFVTVWGNGGIVPPRLNEVTEGKYQIIGDSIPGFQIDQNNPLFASKGHLSGYVVELTKRLEEDFFRFTLKAPSEEFFVEEGFIPVDVVERYSLDDIDR